MRFAVFASGSGTNFEKIAQAVQQSKITGELAFLFCDKKNAFALKRAEKLGVPSIAFSIKEFENKKEYEREILRLLEKEQVDFIVLAGYMKIIGETLLHAFPQKILNIHPAYLPEFPGANGILDAWNEGVAQSGVTVHFVDEGIDTGQIIEQVRVPIMENDTIETFEERIHQAEYKLYPRVIQKYIESF
ncbi:phosphoribosylglycinamide formyltransferase-1 [Pilibacter termitis]|uniref:Phosphoribosylglycinamide formyltransferase n=1 Tax=Pilibacter termitis TaxID=263852 RepID=A0A1T4QS69_9ENTE|nr:phosphoribosylglycinamide formyltransferase [Pilibacter termitis]SKA06516.1 phosphoribosylglycinamide formyltransferase-1 [Pilibacter termitis]